MDINKEQQVKKLSLLWLMIILAASVPLVNCSNDRVIEKTQIILISVDTLRGDHLTSSGYFRDTSPHLSQLIEDSVYYPNAYPNGCWTMPSHMSLLTGTLPSRHGINKDWKTIHDKKYPKLNESIKTIAEVLKSQDIKTIKFAQLPPGLGFIRGFEMNNGGDPFFDDKKFSKLLQVLENNKEEDFFLFIHTWMAHAPYSNSYFLKDEKIDPKKRNYINNFRKVSKKGKIKNHTRIFRNYLQENNLFNVDGCVTLYDSGIHYVDRFIGKIIEKSKHLDIYDNLLFIVVSDHGEHFNEHYDNEFYGCHGRDFYEEFVNVPIIIKYPYTSQSQKIDHPVSLIDVFPTILDFYQFEFPPFIQGESLLKPPSPKKPKAIISEAVSLSDIERKMIRLGDLKYIITMKNPSKAGRVNWKQIIDRRLFDLKADPLEKDNLYNNLKYRKICIQLEKMLIRRIKNSTKTNLRVKETKVSEETLKQMEALGYL